MQFIWAYIPALIQRTTHFLHLWTTDFSIKYMWTLFNLFCMIQRSLCAPKTQLEYQLLLYKNTNIKLRFDPEGTQVVYQNLSCSFYPEKVEAVVHSGKYVDGLRYWAVCFRGYKICESYWILKKKKLTACLLFFCFFLIKVTHNMKINSYESISIK